MNTILTGATRTVRARAIIVIVAAVAVSIAALAVLEAAGGLTDSGFPEWLGNYLAQVGDALGP